MRGLRAEGRAGLTGLETVTSLLQRIRGAHPTHGLYEAADLQWWWGQRPRPTDDLPQLFWFDSSGRPEAAVIITDGGGTVQCDPMFMPGADSELVTEVVSQGLANASRAGYRTVSLEVDPADEVLRAVLAERGFAVDDEAVVEAWLAAGARPAVSDLADGYRLTSRHETTHRPHHMINAARNHPDPAARLVQTSLYRAGLDLVAFDNHDEVAAYGLFWYDPITATGLVEPMRTEDAHQGKGLARHVLTSGVNALVAAGVERIKICFDPGNAASSHLYRSVGFQPARQTVAYSGPTS